jgi:hypothetical protein
MNIQHLSPPAPMLGGFKLPGAQIRGFGWKLVDAGSMRVRVNFEACKLQTITHSSSCKSQKLYFSF